MGKYNTSKKDKKLKRLEKKIKKKYLPKKGLSAYLYYCQERRVTLKKEQPGLENREVVAVMSKEWNSLTPEQKEPYIKKQEEDQERYEHEKLLFQDMQLNKGKKRKYIRVNAGTQVEEGDTEGRNCAIIKVIEPTQGDVMMKNMAVETMKHSPSKENIDKGDLKEESDSKEAIDINKIIKEHSDIMDEDSSEVSIKEEEDNSSTEIKEEELPVIEEPREKLDPKEMKTSILSFIES